MFVIKKYLNVEKNKLYEKVEKMKKKMRRYRWNEKCYILEKESIIKFRERREVPGSVSNTSGVYTAMTFSHFIIGLVD